MCLHLCLNTYTKAYSVIYMLNALYHTVTLFMT